MSPFIRNTRAGGLIAAAAVVAAVVSAPGVAFASVAATSNVTYATHADTDFDVNTSVHYWSVAAVRSLPGQDYDLTVTSASTGQVAASDAYAANTDFVAIDTNLLALGAYRATAYRFSGAGNPGANYDFEFADQAHVFTPTLYGQTTSSPGNSGDQVDYDPAISRGTDVVKVFDVHLDAGQYYVLKSIYNFLDDGNVFLLSSDPGNSATWMRGRTSALQVHPSTIGVSSGGCTRIRAARSAWYGLVVTFDDHNGGYHSWEGYDVEKATASQGISCDQAGSF